ncbi:unnamed protein product [Auanema sp. JU1783]|nr:unnamed protein product [Auanema sp. JU1783]
MQSKYSSSLLFFLVIVLIQSSWSPLLYRNLQKGEKYVTVRWRPTSATMSVSYDHPAQVKGLGSCSRSRCVHFFLVLLGVVKLDE